MITHILKGHDTQKKRLDIKTFNNISCVLQVYYQSLY